MNLTFKTLRLKIEMKFPTKYVPHYKYFFFHVQKLFLHYDNLDLVLLFNDPDL